MSKFNPNSNFGSVPFKFNINNVALRITEAEKLREKRQKILKKKLFKTTNVNQVIASNSSSDETASNEPATVEPVVDETASDEPVVGETASDEPVVHKDAHGVLESQEREDVDVNEEQIEEEIEEEIEEDQE